MNRCPHCASYGLYKNRRALWRRLVRLPHTYSCIDCGADFSRRSLLSAQASHQAGSSGQGEVPDGQPARRGQRSFSRSLRQAVTHAGHLARRLHERLTRRTGSADLAERGRRALDDLLQASGLTPISVWVIKQVDGDLLHLCGSGCLEPQQRPWAALRDLRQGRYRGGVRLGNTGVVLNSRLFVALVPRRSLALLEPTRARWQGREWRVARVPRRSWEYEGRLVALGEAAGGEALVSSEDVSGIRDHIDPPAGVPGAARFQPGTGRPNGYAVRGPMPRRN